MEKIILKYALQNAIKYNGKADVGAVIGKVLNEIKIEDKKSLIEKVRKIVNDINKLSLEKQNKELERIAPELLEKKVIEERDIFAFLGIKKGEKIITAFPPGPEKYPHIGHAKACILNYELAKKYKGKFILRFEDTNPLKVKKEFYKVMIRDFKWLQIKWNKLDYASDYINRYYKFAEELIKKDLVYVCCCSKERIKEYRFKGIICECRNNSKERNIELWKNMFSKKTKNIILRLKIDMQHLNSVMRDPTIMRIIDYKHPRHRKKYRVWPTYDFQNAIMDGIEKVTHRLRSKEFELRNPLQRYIQRILGFKETNIYEFARFNLTGVISSGRVMREKIEKGEMQWDDPSLTTITALRRRGFCAKAIKEFIFSTGITKVESTASWDELALYNRRIIDNKTKRYFFVENPKEIEIKNAPKIKAKVPLHPSNKKLGYKIIDTNKKFHISDKLEKDKVYRFMHLFNFKNNEFISEKYDESLNAKLIHWLPVSKDLIKIEIVMPNGEIKKGLGEKQIRKIKVNEVVQFERNFFCRLDKKEKSKMIFWYTHN